MRVGRSGVQPKLAAAVYLLAMGLPAALPVVAGLGHAVFHVGRAVQEAQAFESTFLSPHLSGAVPDDPVFSVDEVSGAPVSPEELRHLHEDDSPIRPHANAPVGGHAHASGASRAEATHTHGAEGEAHTHSPIVDGALTLVTGGPGEDMSPRASSAGIDNHVPPAALPRESPPTGESEAFVVLTRPPRAPIPPAVPPPKA